MYLAPIRSVAEYDAPPLFPWIEKTYVDQLETTQLVVARAITHLMSTTSLEVVLMEASLPPLTRLGKRGLRHADKWSRLQSNGPRYEMTTGNMVFRLRRTGRRLLAFPEQRRFGIDANLGPQKSPPSRRT